MDKMLNKTRWNVYRESVLLISFSLQVLQIADESLQVDPYVVQNTELIRAVFSFAFFSQLWGNKKPNCEKPAI